MRKWHFVDCSLVKGDLKIDYGYRLKLSTFAEVMELFFNTKFGKKYASGYIDLIKERRHMSYHTATSFILDWEAQEHLREIEATKNAIDAEAMFYTPNELEAMKKAVQPKTLIDLNGEICSNLMRQMVEGIEKYGAIYIAENGSYFPNHAGIIEHSSKFTKELDSKF